MIERIEDMPSGAIGLRAGGRLSKEEYVQALQAGVESGELRLLSLWVAKAMHMFAWLTPGEVKIYEPNELDEAKAWVAAR
jgi:hypothetical protein